MQCMAHWLYTLFTVGFGDRLLSEMKKQTPRDIKIRVGIVIVF